MHVDETALTHAALGVDVSELVAALATGAGGGACVHGLAGSGKTLMAHTLARLCLDGATVVMDGVALADEAADENALALLLARAVLPVARCGRGMVVLDNADALAPGGADVDLAGPEARSRALVYEWARELRAAPVFIVATTRDLASLWAPLLALLPVRVALGALALAPRAALLKRLVPALCDEELEALSERRLVGFTGGDVRRLVVDATLSAPAGGSLGAAQLWASPVRPAALSSVPQQELGARPPRLADVAGLDEQKLALMAALHARRGALLHGPAGSGKTWLALAACGEAGLPVLSVRGVDVLSAVVGESEKALADVFERACAAAPCVVLLDQLDALAPPAGPRLTATQSRLLACLVAEMDRCRGIALIATVERLEACDASVLGAGRLENVVALPAPSLEHGLAVLRYCVRTRVHVGPDVTEQALDFVARRAPILARRPFAPAATRLQCVPCAHRPMRPTLHCAIFGRLLPCPNE